MKPARYTAIFILMAIHTWGVAGAQVLPDTTRLYFQLGDPGLTRQAGATIDSLVYNELLTPDKELIIVGYADYLGSEDANLKLSENRAKNVQAYLSGLGIRKTNIKLVEGKGEIKRETETATGYAADRRVDIVLAERLKKVSTPTTTKTTTVPKPKTTEPPTTLTAIPVGQTLVLRNIYFHAGRHIVKQESVPELDKLYDALFENPKLKIQIEGHVCCVPQFADALDEDTFEQMLSVNRAKYIYNYLVYKGIEKSRMSYVGFGRRRPVVPVEKTLEDEDLNRRVEIRVVEN